jgi:hypothetical protein
MIRKRKRDGNCTLADAQALGLRFKPYDTVVVAGEPAVILSAHALVAAHLAPRRHCPPPEILVRGTTELHYVVQFKDKRRIVVSAADVKALDRPAPDLTWLGQR